MKEFSKEKMKQSLLENPRLKKLFEKYEADFNDNAPDFIYRLTNELYSSRRYKPVFSDFFFEERPAVQRVHFFVAVCILGAVSTALVPTGFWGVSVGTVLMLCAAVIEAVLALVSLVRYLIAKNEYQEIKKSVELIQGYNYDWNKLCYPERAPSLRSYWGHDVPGRFFNESHESAASASTATAGLDFFGNESFVNRAASNISAHHQPIPYHRGWEWPQEGNTLRLDPPLQLPPRASAAAVAFGDSSDEAAVFLPPRPPRFGRVQPGFSWMSSAPREFVPQLAEGSDNDLALKH